jgi:hypothetical protein
LTGSGVERRRSQKLFGVQSSPSRLSAPNRGPRTARATMMPSTYSMVFFFQWDR